ncbi:aquaporin [Candidatus Nomurabacteria bacterium]|nr:aquaporin [Candidatus Nomurabacteria bacterium]
MATRKNASSSTSKSTAKRASSARAKASSTTKTRVVTKKTAVKPAVAQTETTRTRSGLNYGFAKSPLLAASIAELIGTFIFAGVVLATQGTDIYVFFGLVAVILSFAAISGAHVNPALTMGAWATKRISGARALSYFAAQTIGALLALVVMNAYVSAAPKLNDQAAMFGAQQAQLFTIPDIPGGKEWLILAAELIGMTIFAFAFARAGFLKSRLSSAVTISGGLFVALLVGGFAAKAVTGAVILNPAVAASVQAVSWDLWPIMVYVVTPLVGGVIGCALHDLLRSNTATQTELQ